MDINVWSLVDGGTAFPEQRDGLVEGKSSIATSGGGPRALSCSVGYFRALHALHEGKQLADYLSAVSGGAWFSSLYTFAEGSTTELLGELVEPEELTLDALGKNVSPGRIGMTMTSSFLDDAFLSVFEGEADELWEAVVEKVVLEPFGLDHASFDDVAGASVGGKTVKPRSKRPFLIINATLEGPEDALSKNSSLQVTPMYTGIPFYQQDRLVDYQIKSGCLSCFGEKKKMKAHADYLIVGGGVITSGAFGCKAPENEEGQFGGTSVRVPKPEKPFTLGKAIAFSSAAFAEDLKNRKGDVLEDALDPTTMYWPVLDKSNPTFAKSQGAQKMVVGDGGNMANLGFMQLLQRGVEKAILFMNSPTKINMNFKAVKGSKNTKFGDVADTMLLTLFGVDPPFAHTSSWNYTKNQVFQTVALNDVLADLQQSVRDGKGGVCMAKLKLLDNLYWNIKGGREVEILIVYNEICHDFVGRLPEETRNAINDKDGEFKNFPQFSTTEQNGVTHFITYTQSQVNLLAAHSQFVIQLHADLVKRFLKV